MKSNRKRALEWWDKLHHSYKECYCLKYRYKKYNERSENYHSLTDNEIESIWENETQTLTQEYIDSKLNDTFSDLVDEELDRGLTFIKPNQKQFKQFNESLFKAYINKFNDEDKLKMLKVLFLEQTKECPLYLANDLLEYCG